MIKQLKNPTYLEMIAEFQREMQSTTSLPWLRAKSQI